MKIRTGFVGNSSSSSFLIPLDKLSGDQLDKIQNHASSEAFKNDDYCSSSDEWNIRIGENNVHGWTPMDNFDMWHYLTEVLRIPEEDIEWEGC